MIDIITSLMTSLVTLKMIQYSLIAIALFGIVGLVVYCVKHL